MRFLAPDNLITSRPSLHTGIARNFSQSAYPTLWRGLKGLWCPSVGIQGRKLVDFSGNGRDGIFSTSMGSDAWVPSPWGWALQYDGINDCVDLGVNVVDMNGDFTVMFRAYLEDITSNTYCGVGASVSGSGASGYFMCIHRADRGGYVLQSDTGPGTATYSSSPNRPAIAKQWHTILMRRTPTGLVMFQDDYVIIADGTNPTFVPSNTQNWAIGSYDPINVIVLFKGKIGDVMIWNRGLDGREMELLAQGYAHPLTLADSQTFSKAGAAGSVSTAGSMMLMGLGN